MARPRKVQTGLPKYVRIRHGAYHYDKPGGLRRKLCRVEEGEARMHEMLALLIKEEIADGTIRIVKAKPVSNEPGIYFMFQNDVCVYVGKAVNVKRRVTQRDRLVDRVVMIAEKDPKRRSEIEAEMIRLLNPTHNVHLRLGQRKDGL